MTKINYRMIATALASNAPLHDGYNLLRQAKTHQWGGDITRWIAGEILFSIERGKNVENRHLMPVLNRLIVQTGISHFAHHGWWEKVSKDDVAMQGDIVQHDADDVGIVTDWWLDDDNPHRRVILTRLIGAKPANPEGWRFITPADIAGVEIPTFKIFTYSEDRTLYFQGETPPDWAIHCIKDLEYSRGETRLEDFEEEELELSPVYGGHTQIKKTTFRVVKTVKEIVEINTV